MPRPLFVIGKHRSGTTWLSNLLLSHPEIAGVEHSAHKGIHESAFFSHVQGRFGDLHVFNNHVECSAVLAQSDYFRLAGASFEDLLRLFPTDYPGLFRSIMDRFAKTEETRYWMEKSPMHTLYMRHIGEVYPDARFVGIQRDPVDVAFSSLRNLGGEMSRVRRFVELFRVTLDKYVADRHMLRMRARWPDRVLIVRYEEMTRSPSPIIEQICVHLDLEVGDLSSAYRANSSYSSNRQRRERSEVEVAWVRWLHNDALPLVPAGVLIALKNQSNQWQTRALPDWFFKLLKAEES
jgi:hypothetical protein